MRRSTGLALAAIVLSAAAVRLLPLLSSLYWGSDVGEYYAVLRGTVEGGALPSRYLGWGITYPFFPGMFFVQTAAVDLGGLSVPVVLNLLVPVLGALVSLPIFLLAAGIARDDRVGLFAAALVAGAMPVAYTASHTAPATFADLLAFSALALFVRLRRDPRAFAPLLLASGALVVTHHLSAYFLILMVIGTTALRGVLRPATWPGLRREVVYEACLLGMTFAFWFGYARTFRDNILHVVNFQPWWLLLAAFPALLLLLAGLVVLRRRAAWRYRPTLPTGRYAWGTYGAAVAFVFGFAALAATVSIPGTAIALSAAAIATYAPFLLLLAFAAPGRKLLDFLPDGLGASAWFLLLGASGLLGTFVATQILIPYRHVEYLVIPLAVFAGTGFVWSFRALGPRPAVRTGAFALSLVLFAGTFATAIPPPGFLGGWDEGTPDHALSGAYWARDHVQGLTVADHRASSILFGFAGVNGTWDATASPFFATNFTDARPGLVSVYVPSGRVNASYVWVDGKEASGVQLLPWDPAMPMSSAAQAKFSDTPFLKVYDDGFARVYWIDWGLAP